MRRADFLRNWVPGILFISSLVLAATTPLNPWIIGACTGTLIVIVLVVDWLIRRGKRRDAAAKNAA